MTDLDPRWEWAEITALGDREPQFIRVRCRHLETHPVTSIVTGELLAELCVTCDTQLPPRPWRQIRPGC